MDTLESIHIDTCGTATAVQMTFGYTITNALDETESGLGGRGIIDVQWTMGHVSLRRFLQMVTESSGAPIPAVRVTGSIISGESRARRSAVRVRPVIEWTASRPLVDGVQVEFATGCPSDEDLMDCYCTLGLRMDVAAWATLHAAVDQAAAVLATSY